jgi:hypothetical protein
LLNRIPKGLQEAKLLPLPPKAAKWQLIEFRTFQLFYRLQEAMIFKILEGTRSKDLATMCRPIFPWKTQALKLPAWLFTRT